MRRGDENVPRMTHGSGANPVRHAGQGAPASDRPEVSSIRLVVNPEKMVIKETQRTYTYLNLYGYATDAILCNRIIPAEVNDPYFAMWKANQQENISLHRRGVRRTAADARAVVRSGSRRTGCYVSLPPNFTAIRTPPRSSSTAGRTDRSSGKRQLPPDRAAAVRRQEDLDLYRSRDELTLRVGPYRRNIVLPYTLWDLEIGDARFEQSTLHPVCQERTGTKEGKRTYQSPLSNLTPWWSCRTAGAMKWWLPDRNDEPGFLCAGGTSPPNPRPAGDQEFARARCECSSANTCGLAFWLAVRAAWFVVALCHATR